MANLVFTISTISPEIVNNDYVEYTSTLYFDATKGGTVYWANTDSATPPNNTAIKAGTGANDFGSYSIADDTNVNAVDDSAWPKADTYIHYFVEDAAGVPSGTKTTLVSGAAINRVQLGADDKATLSSVSASGPDFTIAIRAANKSSPDSFAVFATGQAESQYLILSNADGTFSVRPRNSTGTALFIMSGGATTKGDMVNIVVAINSGEIVRLWVNGQEAAANSGAGIVGATNVEFPGNINSTTFAQIMDVSAFAVYEAYLDPEQYWSTWFTDDGSPAVALLNGSAVGGITPTEQQSGDAAAWNAAYSADSLSVTDV